MADLASQLLDVVREPEIAGIAIRAEYQPTGGPGEKLMPPSYPDEQGGPYLRERLWVDGEVREAVVLDQVPSQANRIEEALLDARDDGAVQFPIFEMIAKTSRGEVRLTSLDFPHRYADAYLRDALVEGQRFDASAVGQRLREASDNDARALYEREPLSLILGAWDSHRKGRWPKFARVYQSRMFGLDPQDGARAGTRIDPVNLVGAVDDKEKAEGDWQFVPSGEKKKGSRLSEIGHGNIAPMRAHGGVSVSSARRIASISQAALRRVRFGTAGAEASDLARAALLALALAGDRLAFGRASLWLRSGCDLVRVREEIVVERDGGVGDMLSVTAGSAIAAFHDLRDRAAEAGLPMALDTIPIEPNPSLQAAIEYAVSAAEAVEE